MTTEVMNVSRLPACKGTNCGCTDGRSHSAECVAEYEECTKMPYDELNCYAEPPEDDMEQGYYSVIATPREALYEAACAMDNQDVPLEDWPTKLIAALARAGFAVVPAELPHDVLGRAAIAGVAETGNPKHAWDFLIAATRAA